jgi:curli biogenesis system outer membrane secretion channel CsgG
LLLYYLNKDLHKRIVNVKKKLLPFIAVFVLILLFSSCSTTESSRALDVGTTKASKTPYSGPRAPIAVGKFDDRTNFYRGLFSDGQDRLGSQSKTILITHLQQTYRFDVYDRENMEELKREAEILGENQQLQGASFVVTGDITEFGRKEVGDYQLWGIIGRGRKQIAYSKVTLYVVNIRTSAVVYSAQGAGEYELSEREVLGFGTVAGYDSTLNGKVLDLAIREAVDRLTVGIDSGVWKPSGN